VDDILLIYDQKKTNIDETLAKFNEQQPTIKYIIGKELHNSIDFLKLSIHRRVKYIKFAIYKKPIQTDIIPNDYCRPHKHKISSINYLVNRLNTYSISKEAKENELNIIKAHYITIYIL
jgi:hypothetical protein